MNTRVLPRATVLAAMLFLAGCLVISDHRPLQQGPQNDSAIVGAWQSLDETTGEPEDTFVHIQRPDEEGPLRVVVVDQSTYAIYELVTTIAGTRKVFSLRGLAPEQAINETMGKSALGYYEVSGDELTFYPLDSEKVSNLIRTRELAGVAGAKTYDNARLTGSPAELTRFLASARGWTSRVENGSRMKRIKTGN